MKLAEIAYYVTDKISSECITLEEYVTTDSILQNKRGRVIATNLPPDKCTLTHFFPGDVLIANIRPYLKKIWFADIAGGCSADVLVFRAKEGHNSQYLYALLLQDSFYTHAMNGSKGSKMPRGDKDQIMRYKIPMHLNEECIGILIMNINQKIAINQAINQNLEAMAKLLYGYWFVQFDFPDENSHPYKSSGGKMVWNEKLKREIPEGWEVAPLNEWLEIKSGFAFKSETYESTGQYKVITIKNVQDHYLDTTNCDYLSQEPEGFKEWCRLTVGDRLISLTGNCGRLCIVTETNLLLNQRVGLLSCDESLKEYAYWLLSSEEYQKNCQNLANGAAQANLSPIDVCKLYAVRPASNILNAYNEILEIQTQLYINNEIEVRSLTKQLDELLPLLMNGQASVNSDLSLD